MIEFRGDKALDRIENKDRFKGWDGEKKIDVAGG